MLQLLYNSTFLSSKNSDVLKKKKKQTAIRQCKILYLLLGNGILEVARKF